MKDWEKSSKYLVEGQPDLPRRQVRTELGPKRMDKQDVATLAAAGDIAVGKPRAHTEVRMVEARKPAPSGARIKIARPPRKRYRT